MRTVMTAIVASFALSSAVGAAEVPKSGTFEGRWYSHNVETIDELETADGMKSYINQGFEFKAGKQPGDLFNGMSVRCPGYGRYSADTGVVKETGRCTNVDANGDQVFEEYEVELTGPNDTSPAKAQILGGTGKYKGIKGVVIFQTGVWPALGKTDTMWAGNYKGEYKIGD
jgi:hypothetical protein